LFLAISCYQNGSGNYIPASKAIWLPLTKIDFIGSMADTAEAKKAAARGCLYHQN
jgi:hypothetical protein